LTWMSRKHVWIDMRPTLSRGDGRGERAADVGILERVRPVSHGSSLRADAVVRSGESLWRRHATMSRAEQVGAPF
jgi:hypothetical protein